MEEFLGKLVHAIATAEAASIAPGFRSQAQSFWQVTALH